ncbi:MAG: hypothetical protein SH819_05460 [Cytophagales bacterium]|nr:hypothetical protein [Cytophagales bacterium]
MSILKMGDAHSNPEDLKQLVLLGRMEEMVTRRDMYRRYFNTVVANIA